MTSKQVTKEDLINDIQRVEEEARYGRWMPLREYERLGKHSESTIRSRFGRWSDALDEAGLMNREKFQSKEHMIEDMQKVANMRNRPITKSYYKRKGSHNPKTVIDKFGSWSEGVEAAGLENGS